MVFGLGGIKNVGGEAINEIVEARRDGPYLSLLDLACRVNLRKVTKRVLENLIKGGACDCLNAPRAALLDAIDLVVARAQKKAKEKASNQVSLLAMAPQAETAARPGIGLDCPQNDIPEMPDDEKLRGEKEALGFFLTSHPLQPFRREIVRLGLTTLEDARDLFPGAEIRCAILVTGLKEITTKKGDRMAFVSVEDLTGHGEMTVFPRTYAECRELLKSEQPLYVEAKLDAAEEHAGEDDAEDVVRELKMLGNKVMPLAEVCQKSDAPITILIPSTHCTRARLLELRSILEEFPGDNEASAHVLLDGHRCILRLGPRLMVRPGPDLDKALTQWMQARC